MRKYQSHKMVEASVIRAFQASPPSVMVGDDADGVWRPFVNLPADIFARGTPQIGDYLVVYEDGYVSWSPKDAFENGYTLVA